MAFKNVIDNSSTTVTTATPGAYLDMRYRTTMSRASLGVPVRFKVYASSTVASDTGAVKLLNSDGADVISVPITGSTATWYPVDGYLPATLAKYDVHYGGNTLGTLKVLAFSLYEISADAPAATLSASIGSFALTATADNTSLNLLELSQSIGDFTLSATGTVRT